MSTATIERIFIVGFFVAGGIVALALGDRMVATALVSLAGGYAAPRGAGDGDAGRALEAMRAELEKLKSENARLRGLPLRAPIERNRDKGG